MRIMPCIKLRRRAGTGWKDRVKTLIVSAALIIEGGKTLVTQRKEGASLGLLWEFPGGKIEQCEEPRQALKRELREELGIEVKVGPLFGATFYPYPEYPVLLLVYRCSVEKGVPRPLKSRDLRWASFDELNELTMPPADEPIRRQLSSLGESHPSSSSRVVSLASWEGREE